MPGCSGGLRPVARRRGHRCDIFLLPRLPDHLLERQYFHPLQQHPRGQIIHQGTLVSNPGRHDHVPRFLLPDPRHAQHPYVRPEPNSARGQFRNDLRFTIHQNEQNRPNIGRQQEEVPHKEADVHERPGAGT